MQSKEGGMNKRWFALATLLFAMAARRCAFGQDGSPIGWDTVVRDPIEDVAAVMIAAPILGVIFGVFRVLRTQSTPPALEPLRLH